MQLKQSHLSDEKLLQDNEFKTKHDSNQATLMGLKNEIDNLRFLLSEKDRQNGDLQGEAGSNRDSINRKEVEISSQKNDIAQRSDQGYAMRKDIDNLRYEIGKLNEEKAKDIDEIRRLQDMVSYRGQEN